MSGCKSIVYCLVNTGGWSFKLIELCNQQHRNKIISSIKLLFTPGENIVVVDCRYVATVHRAHYHHHGSIDRWPGLLGTPAPPLTIPSPLQWPQLKKEATHQKTINSPSRQEDQLLISNALHWNLKPWVESLDTFLSHSNIIVNIVNYILLWSIDDQRWALVTQYWHWQWWCDTWHCSQWSQWLGQATDWNWTLHLELQTRIDEEHYWCWVFWTLAPCSLPLLSWLHSKPSQYPAIMKCSTMWFQLKSIRNI